MVQLIIAGVLSIGLVASGYWVGVRVERAERVSIMEAELDQWAERTRAREAAIQSSYDQRIENYRVLLRRANERAQRNQEIVYAESSRVERLQSRLIELQERFAGVSSCHFDYRDISVLNEAIEAAASAGRH